jgi:hypothetical protein
VQREVLRDEVAVADQMVLLGGCRWNSSSTTSFALRSLMT